MHRFVFILTALLLAPAGFGQSHDHHGAMPPNELGAEAVFDAKGVLWAAHKKEGRVVVSRSEDRGHSWFEPIRLTPEPEATDTGGDARPKIALGSGGEIYVTWTKSLSKPYTGEIRFARSVDGGKTFSPSMVVHRDRQEITHRFDSIAVNPKGQIFVAWIDKRDLVAAGQNTYRGAAIYFAVSDDRGATFRGDFKLVDHACECCRIALATRPDGAVVAFWRNIFEPNIRDHALATLQPDGKTSPIVRATFEDWRIDACPHHGPSLAFDDSAQPHAVWFSGAANARGAFYGRLRDKTPDALRPLGPEQAGHADIAVQGKHIAIAWKVFENDRTHLRGMISADGGRTWQESELASTAGPSDHPQMLTRGERFYVFWNTRDEPLGVIAFP